MSFWRIIAVRVPSVPYKLKFVIACGHIFEDQRSVAVVNEQFGT